MVTAIVVRELLIQGLRSHLEGQGQPFGARTAGKLKTVVQCAVDLGRAALPGLEPSSLADARSGSATASPGWPSLLTLYSGLVYVWIALPKLRGES